jgi:hypothetical protein
VKEIKPATDEDIAAIEAIYADNPASMWDFTIEECMALIARIRKAEDQRDALNFEVLTGNIAIEELSMYLEDAQARIAELEGK